MGSTEDKAKGTANEMIGETKQGIGKVANSPSLQQEGREQEAKGTAQKIAGQAKEAVKDTANKVADKINEAL
jgi:uncharacterized protein YjbJ (UPF0337 family)